jgi:hypothetical protein
MSEIYVNDGLKIFQDKNNKMMYKIHLDYSNPQLLRSLIKPRLIEGGTITDDYKSLRFNALSVKSFAEYKAHHNKIRGSPNLSINIIVQMLESLTKQLNYLILKERRTILGYTASNIIVINDKTFAFLGSDLVADISPKDNHAIVSCPFNVRDFFASPEMLKMRILPGYVHYKASYFSLGCLILYSLISEDDFYIEYLKELDINKMDDYLNQLHFKGSKLYWLLSRCLVEDAEKRSIIYF